MSAFTTARSSGTTILLPSTLTSMFLTPAAPDDVLSTQPHKAREIATTTQAECLSFILLSPSSGWKINRCTTHTAAPVRAAIGNPAVRSEIQKSQPSRQPRRPRQNLPRQQRQCRYGPPLRRQVHPARRRRICSTAKQLCPSVKALFPDFGFSR